MDFFTSAASRAWLMEPGRLRALIEGMARAVRVNGWPTPAQLEERRQAQANMLRQIGGKVAVVPVHGIIDQHGDCWYCDNCSTDQVGQCIQGLAGNPTVDAIVLDVDSPGGTSYGVQELGDVIFEVRKLKPIYALSNSLCASAAYWIASQCTAVYSTPGGDTGSIGVFAVHMEVSKALDEEGIKVTIAKAGQYKAEMNPFEPLAPEARDYLQEMVDLTYAKFVASVARGRGVQASKVLADFGQGRCMMADQALAAGLVDKIMTLDDVLQSLGGQPVNGMGRDMAEKKPSIEVLRLRHQHERRKAALSLPPRKADDDDGMAHDSTTSDNEPPWEDVDQSRLPDVAFADQSTRQYAHHYVQDGGGLEDDGDGDGEHYTTGTLVLHKAALEECYKQANDNGASPDILGHLEDHRDDLGLTDEEPDEEEDSNDPMPDPGDGGDGGSE